jgi:hypothetical protein
MLQYEFASRTNALSVAWRCRLLRDVLTRGVSWPHDVKPLTVREIYLNIRDDYVPLPARIEHVVLVKASETRGGDEALRERFDDPLLGWGRLIDGTLDAVDAPGGHSSMLQEPAVQGLAAILTQLLSPDAQETPGTAALTGSSGAIRT